MRAALRDEAEVWRAIGQWVDTFPRRLTIAMVTGIACFLGGRNVVDAMGARLVVHGGRYPFDGPDGYRDNDYFATACLFLALECDDEARALTPKRDWPASRSSKNPAPRSLSGDTKPATKKRARNA